LSEQTFSHLPEHYTLGEIFSNRYGIRCYPATDNRTGMRYVAKVQTFPHSPSVTEAFLLSGAFESEKAVNEYYYDLGKDLCRQAAILNAFSHTQYFSHITSCEIVKNKNNNYEIWFLSPFYTTLSALFKKISLSKEKILELGITLCHALSLCREAGFLYTGIKPENIFIAANGQFMIGDVGFISLPSLPYAALPLNRHTIYTPSDCHDCYSSLSDNLDVYGVGVVLYQACCGGIVPERITTPPQIDNKILAEIIMTACLPASAGRWKNPAEMEAALVSCQSEGIKQ
jgi:serine/threonine protein kinase